MLTQRQLVRDGKMGFAMPFTKTWSLLDDFPWLRQNHRNLLGYSQYYVSTLDDDIFDYNLMSEREVPHPEFCYTPSDEEMLFLDEKGQVVVKEQIFPTNRKKYIFFGPPVRFDIKYRIRGEVKARSFSSPVRTVAMLGDAMGNATYVLSHFRYTNAVIVYKVPKDFASRAAARMQSENAR